MSGLMSKLSGLDIPLEDVVDKSDSSKWNTVYPPALAAHLSNSVSAVDRVVAYIMLREYKHTLSIGDIPYIASAVQVSNRSVAIVLNTLAKDDKVRISPEGIFIVTPALLNNPSQQLVDTWISAGELT